LIQRAWRRKSSYGESGCFYKLSKHSGREGKDHKKKTFKEEYMDFLQKFAIEYNEKYLFEWIDE